MSGEHMKPSTFVDAVGWATKVEAPAWKIGAPPIIMLSGGECSEHPNFVDFALGLQDLGIVPMIITNGRWLSDKAVCKELLRKESKIFVQVTHDDRFYPGDPPERLKDERVVYVNRLSHLIPLGRATVKKVDRATSGGDVATKQYPTSFNFRSLVRKLRSVASAVQFMRIRSAQQVATGKGMWSMCTPSVSWDGSVHAGETIECHKIGTVNSTDEELTKATLDMQCNKCGLENNLSEDQKRAIGNPVIYAASTVDAALALAATRSLIPRNHRKR